MSQSTSNTLIQEWKETITAIDAMVSVGSCLKDRASTGAIGHIDDVVSALTEQRSALQAMIDEEINTQLRNA